MTNRGNDPTWRQIRQVNAESRSDVTRFARAYSLSLFAPRTIVPVALSAQHKCSAARFKTPPLSTANRDQWRDGAGSGVEGAQEGQNDPRKDGSGSRRAANRVLEHRTRQASCERPTAVSHQT